MIIMNGCTIGKVISGDNVTIDGDINVGKCDIKLEKPYTFEVGDIIPIIDDDAVDELSQILINEINKGN